MDTDRLGYVSYRLAPRAPRVAVVVSGDMNWRFWFRLALYGASRTWGGAGFVLVPHDNGTVHPTLLQGISTYDPDYVMLQHRALGDVETLSPGSVPIVDPDSGMEHPPDRRAEIVSTAATTPVHDPAGEAARHAVVAACSPHRRFDATAAEWEEDVVWWPTDDTTYGLTAISELGLDASGALSVPADARGDVALTLTARIGATARPDPQAAVAVDEPDPAVVSWLLDGIGSPPTWWGPTDPHPTTAFDVGRTGLSSVVNGPARPAPTLITAGDTAADCALALLWDRLYGGGLWLPRAWWPTTPGRLGDAVARALRRKAMAGGGRSRRLELASTTVTDDELNAIAQLLTTERNETGTTRRDRDPIATTTVTWPWRGILHLAVADQFDQRFALPVRRDNEGSVEMAAPPPPPTIAHPVLAGQDNLRWEVDLQPERTDMPSGRGLDGHTLLVDEDEVLLTWVRSGRDGTTYNAQRYDLVMAGASPEAKLARPRLRELGLLAWAHALGRPQGQAYRLSDAGLRVQILTRMAGGREALVDSLVGPLRPALRSFNVQGRSTTTAYPGGEGVVLADGGYLTLTGMASLIAANDLADVRSRVDELLLTGILRRGAILLCAACQRPSFVHVDALRQRNACPRCGHVNDLVQARWRLPVDEPAWFYDLHPAARELFSQHGDVPLLLSGHLRRTSRRYADIAELEMFDPATNTGVAEADLLALADGRVLTAEAKSNSVLGETTRKVKQAAGKRALLAQALGADEVVLATTSSSWAVGSVDAMRTALTARSWPRGAPPVLRTLTGLGTNAARDTVIDLQSGASTPYAGT